MPDSLKKIEVDLIVFDLDGTLADSLPDLTNAANYALGRLDLPGRSPEEVRGMIGGGERKFMERLVGPGHQDLVDNCLEFYLDRYTPALRRPDPALPRGAGDPGESGRHQGFGGLVQQAAAPDGGGP